MNNPIAGMKKQTTASIRRQVAKKAQSKATTLDVVLRKIFSTNNDFNLTKKQVFSPQNVDSKINFSAVIGIPKNEDFLENIVDNPPVRAVEEFATKSSRIMIETWLKFSSESFRRMCLI